MALINVTQDNTFEQWRIKTNDISTLVGDGATLATTALNLVAAINELRSGAIQGTLTVSDTQFKVQVDAGDPVELTLDASGNLTITGNLIANVTGNADTATKLATTRSISITGDATWTTNFDGTGNVTGALTLANSGVSAGTYTKITVDSKGRATSGTSLSSSDVTTALGYTPWHSGNDGAGSGLDADVLDGYQPSTGADANTIVLRHGDGSLSANIMYGTATAARYADLAEKYTTDLTYATGTVIVVALGGSADCTQSWAPGQVAIGVISEKPAYLMNSESEGQPVALKGRVPVRVVGAIKKGESIMAGPDGRAMQGNTNIIGVALETNAAVEEKLVECIIL